jgi:sarcosine oxidase
MSTYDVIVVGVGGMGSATLCHLARRNVKALGIEQYDIPHELGSSHGLTRIIRLAYAEGPWYIPLLRKAYANWRELENRAGERLLFITGGLDIGTKESATVTGSLNSCAMHHLPHEVLNAGTLQANFPGYRLPESMVGVYQPDGGFLLAERCIVSHVNEALSLGADIRARERVTAVQAGSNEVVVRTERATYKAPHAVLTAGPWARSLFPAFQNIAVPERQVLLWAHPLRPEHFRLGAFPVFNMEAPEGRFYGFPIYGIPGFKVGKYHHLHQSGDPSSMDRDCHPEDESIVREAIAKYFPDGNGPTMSMKTCIFTNSPDEHFILDFVPGYEKRVAVAAGFSGHGFKFCSVVGEVMADLAVNGRTDFDIANFRVDRFRSQL